MQKVMSTVWPSKIWRRETFSTENLNIMLAQTNSKPSGNCKKRFAKESTNIRQVFIVHFNFKNRLGIALRTIRCDMYMALYVQRNWLIKYANNIFFSKKKRQNHLVHYFFENPAVSFGTAPCTENKYSSLRVFVLCWQ